MVGTDGIQRPFGQEVVDGGVAHHHAVDLGLTGQNLVVHHLLLIGRHAQSRRVLPGGGVGLREELIHDLPRRHSPHQAAFAEFPSLPRHGHGVDRPDALPHLQDRRQHEERQHRQNGQRRESGPLVLAENVERAGHGTACGLIPRRGNRRDLTRKESGR